MSIRTWERNGGRQLKTRSSYQQSRLLQCCVLLLQQRVKTFYFCSQREKKYVIFKHIGKCHIFPLVEKNKNKNIYNVKPNISKVESKDVASISKRRDKFGYHLLPLNFLLHISLYLTLRRILVFKTQNSTFLAT